MTDPKKASAPARARPPQRRRKAQAKAAAGPAILTEWLLRLVIVIFIAGGMARVNGRWQQSQSTADQMADISEVRAAQVRHARLNMAFSDNPVHLGLPSELRQDVALVATTFGNKANFVAELCRPGRCVATTAEGKSRVGLYLPQAHPMQAPLLKRALEEEGR